MLIGIADSGFDRERLGVKMDGESFVGGDVFQDELGHGTLVASLAAGNRRDLNVRGVAAGAELRVAKIATTGKCRLALTLIKAFKYFRDEGVSVVNVSATLEPTPALRESLRALQLSGALVVAAVGNSGGVLGRDTFPWAEPGVIGVGALSRRSAVADELDALARRGHRRAGPRRPRDRLLEPLAVQRDDDDARRQLVRGAARGGRGRAHPGGAPHVGPRARGRRAAASRPTS